MFFILNKLIPGKGKDTEEALIAFKQISSKAGRQEIPVKIIDEYYDLLGPEKMLEAVGSESQCHIKGHNIGRVIYQKTNDIEQAMLICSDKCTYGCLHGVISGAFTAEIGKKGTSADGHIAIDQLGGIIRDVCSKSGKSVKGGSGICPHGIGHALFALSENNLKKALSYCDDFKDPEQVFDCDNGVFMQYFTENTDKNPQFEEPCAGLGSPAACYRYKLLYNYSRVPYKEVSHSCSLIADGTERSGCFNGLGFAFAQPVRRGEIKPDLLCTGTEDDRKNCINGVIAVVTVYDKDGALNVCSQLSDSDKEYCLKSVDTAAGKLLR